MAAGATIYNFTVNLADVDRSVYEELTLRVAQHPSETDAYMLTRVLAWIEVGAPDASRLHFGSKLADRTTLYTHRDPAKVITAWSGKTIHQADKVIIHSFDRGFIDDAVGALERRNTMTVSVTEGQLYLDLNGRALSTAIHQTPAA